MKIKGPRPPTSPDIEEPTRTESAKGPGGAFADKLAAQGAKAPADPGEVDPVIQVGAQLEAGDITPEQAVGRVMDLALAKSGGDKLPARVQAAIRDKLRALVEDDVYLAGHARRIGVPASDDQPD